MKKAVYTGFIFFLYSAIAYSAIIPGTYSQTDGSWNRDFLLNIGNGGAGDGSWSYIAVPNGQIADTMEESGGNFYQDILQFGSGSFSFSHDGKFYNSLDYTSTSTYTAMWESDGDFMGFFGNAILYAAGTFQDELSNIWRYEVTNDLSMTSFIGGEKWSALSSAQGDIFNREITFEAVPVPDPATVWLFGTGLIGLLSFRKKISK